MAAGITTRHAKTCRSRGGGRCACQPTYQAQVFDGRTGRRISKTLPSMAAAKTWRQDALVAVRNGKLGPARKVTLRATADEWVADAQRGVVTNRSGDRYKPSAIRAYRASLRLRVLDELGDRQFSQITRGDLQRLVDQLVADGLAPSTVQCSILPLRAMYRRALSLDEINVNPTTGLRLPAIRGGRDRIVTPAQAAALIDALPTAHDRALWGTALYAGLRRGELLGLMWEDVDLKAAQIDVRRSWDIVEGHDVGPKSAVGRRKVPIASRLKALLAEYRLASPRAGGHVFGTTGTSVAAIKHVTRRADDAWKAVNDRVRAEAEKRDERVDPAALLERITLHDARHTYASLMIAAGVNAKALSTYMGHANISITLDRYGHLMPGNEAEAATLLDAYLEREILAG
jgi:integrase